MSSIDFLKENKSYIFRFIIFLAIAAFAFFTGGAYVVWLNQKPTVKSNLDRYKSEVSNYFDSLSKKPIRIYDKNSRLIGEFNRRNFRPIRTDNLKDHGTLVWALLSSEDREFYTHGGINYFAIIRAVFINLTQFKLAQGGSTITQQLAKLTLNLGERNIFNKITEAFCAYYIENQYDKDTILSMYMNQIFLGEGNVGLEEAARYYYNKSATYLSPAEAALLVGIIPAPSVYNPVKNLKISLDRQKRVLFDMAANSRLHYNPNKIDKDFGKSIDDQVRKFKDRYGVREVNAGDKIKYVSEIARYGYDKDFKVNLAPDFNESVRRFVLERFSNEELEKKSFSIYTTLEYEKQAVAAESLREGIAQVRKGLEARKEAYAKAGNIEEVKREADIIESINGSLVSLNPYTGHVEALVGSYKISSVYRLNRAEEARRQPGSAIKGFVYALALEKRIINPSSILLDEKININGYSPKNWYGNYKGNMTARQALAQSVNTISVKLLHEMGPAFFINKLAEILSTTPEDLTERMGKNLSLALGSGELTPMELAIVYATIANGGYKVTPKKILRIVDEDNQEYSVSNAEEQKVQILDSTACAMALNLMQAVLSEEGTMSVRLKEKDRFPMAGKTGTVQTPTKVLQKWANRKGVRDSWFAGIIPGNVTTVWIGNDQGAPFPGSGAGNSGQVWLKYALSIKYSLGIEEDTLVRPFEGNFTQVDICGDNGFLLSEVQECKHPLYKQYYYKGEEPKGNQAKPEVAPEKLEFKVEEQEEGTVFDDAPEPETHTPPPENKPPEVNKPEESAPEAPKSNF